MSDHDSGLNSQTVVGHSPSVSFDEALKDAVAPLKTPNPGPHTDIFTIFTVRFPGRLVMPPRSTVILSTPSRQSISRSSSPDLRAASRVSDWRFDLIQIQWKFATKGV